LLRPFILRRVFWKGFWRLEVLYSKSPEAETLRRREGVGRRGDWRDLLQSIGNYYREIALSKIVNLTRLVLYIKLS